MVEPDIIVRNIRIATVGDSAGNNANLGEAQKSSKKLKTYVKGAHTK
jgi:hypothetical protein